MDRQLSFVDEHVKFMCARICHVSRVPDVSDDSIQRGFNQGFTDAFKTISNEIELYDMEDIYINALASMQDFEENSHIARQIITIIRYRLKKLRALSGKVE